MDNIIETSQNTVEKAFKNSDDMSSVYIDRIHAMEETVNLQSQLIEELKRENKNLLIESDRLKESLKEVKQTIQNRNEALEILAARIQEPDRNINPPKLERQTGYYKEASVKKKKRSRKDNVKKDSLRWK
jgi:hypothetical protein